MKPWPERFWDRIDRRGPDECWPCFGAGNAAGYRRIRLPNKGRVDYAHRVAYELVVGPIPDGLCIDHLCRNRVCCNPAHLEPVTIVENFRRGKEAVAREREAAC